MERPTYLVSGYGLDGADGAVTFTFTPKGMQQERGSNGVPRRVSQFIVTACQVGGELQFDWNGTPDDPEGTREEIEKDITIRMQERAVWIKRVEKLVDLIDGWAKKLGWATRRVEKKLDDARVGTHRVPALLMQAETCRIILEPVGRSSLGAEGVVDLYLMPGYDDIASIYYYGDGWMMHYLYPGSTPIAETLQRKERPLSKEALEEVLAEMKQHAA